MKRRCNPADSKKIDTLVIYILVFILTYGIHAFPTAIHNDQMNNVTVYDNITSHLWSPDGSKLAFINCPPSQTWNCELWIADAHLENTSLIYTGSAWDQLYDWEGQWILFGLSPTQVPMLEGGLATAGEIWKIKEDGTELVRLTSTYTNGIRTVFGGSYQNTGTVNYAKFIPDTNLIYFRAHDGNGWWAAYTTTDDGTDNWKRLKSGSYAFTIGISPSGNKLLWGSSTYFDQPTDLWSSDANGSTVNHIKSFPVKTSPLVLSDENTILLSWPDGKIHAIDMDGEHERVVLDDQYTNDWSDYHPLEEQMFLMTSNRGDDGNMHVFELNSDGTNISQVTTGQYDDVDPLYSPNGEYIAYRRLPTGFDSASPLPHPYQLVVISTDSPMVYSLPIANPISTVTQSTSTGQASNGNNLIVTLLIIGGLLFLVVLVSKRFKSKRETSRLLTFNSQSIGPVLKENLTLKEEVDPQILDRAKQMIQARECCKLNGSQGKHYCNMCGRVIPQEWIIE